MINILRTSENKILRMPVSPMETTGYGLLYNWYAATDARGFVSGWHVPASNEFYDLMRYIDSDGINTNNTAGNEIREAGTTYWSAGGGSNDYGFNARGAGERSEAGAFLNILLRVTFWLNVSKDAGDAWMAYIDGNSDIFRTSAYRFGSWAGHYTRKKCGNSIRLIKDDSTDPGYVDIDGLRYNTVKINNVVWLAENLKATHYANGDAITEVTGNSAWAALTTEAMCAYDNDWDNVGDYPFIEIKILRGVIPPLANSAYGLLYNWYAATDARGFVRGWHLPSNSEWNTLMTYLGGSDIAGLHVKINNGTWSNSAADNSSNFSSKICGFRDPNIGGSSWVGNCARFWTSNAFNSSYGYWAYLENSGDLVYNVFSVFVTGGSEKNCGLSIRLIKDGTDPNNPGFVDIDGFRYNTVKIGTQVWMAENLKAEHYANGDSILEVTDSNAWHNLTTESLCAFLNNWDNV